jgi:transposase
LQEENMPFAGVDAHKRYSTVVVKDETGSILCRASLQNDVASFQGFFGAIDGPTKAVLEAGRDWGVIYDLLEGIGVEPVLANPLKTRAIAEARIKTDTVDATTLADLLRADLIPVVHVPPREVRAQKNLLRQRLWLVELKTRIKNRIHNIIDRNHVGPPPAADLFGKAGRHFMDQLQLPSPDDRLLRSHLELLDLVQGQIGRCEEWIDEALGERPEVATMRTLPGFGKILSTLVALEIDDIRRFSHPGKLCAYAGLVPTTYASGGKVRHGRLLPSCNRWLRWAFVEAAWAAQRSSAYCRAYFERIKRRKGANCAVTALARRLCEITWHCLTGSRGYEERVMMPIRKELARPPSAVLGR